METVPAEGQQTFNCLINLLCGTLLNLNLTDPKDPTTICWKESSHFCVFLPLLRLNLTLSRLTTSNVFSLSNSTMVVIFDNVVEYDRFPGLKSGSVQTEERILNPTSETGSVRNKEGRCINCTHKTIPRTGLPPGRCSVCLLLAWNLDDPIHELQLSRNHTVRASLGSGPY